MLKTSQWVLYFLETRQRSMQIVLLQLNATYQARSFRLLPNLQSSYILCYTHSMWFIWMCDCKLLPSFSWFRSVFFFSLSLLLCRRVCRLSWPLFSVRNDQTNPVWVLYPFPIFLLSMDILICVHMPVFNSSRWNQYSFWATLSLLLLLLLFPVQI